MRAVSNEARRYRKSAIHLMGSQSTTPQPRRKSNLLWFAFLLLVLKSVAFAQSATTSALAVPLVLPSAIVFDSAGNLYLADTANHTILKVDTFGQIATIAGNGTQGFSGDNGFATAASLDSPQGVALDAANDLYIADTHNHRIRRLDLASGILVTIAGTGVAGFSGDNAAATAAQLNLPTALAVDSSNNLYLADTGNHRIRRIDAGTGLISTIAGSGIQGFSGDNGPAASAAIDSPTGLAIATGSLYLADTHNHRIRKVDLATGLISTIAGSGIEGFSGDNALATSAGLALPHGLTADASGNLYLADTENHRIRRIDAVTGLISTVAGNGAQTFSGDNGPAISASIDTPRAVALLPSGLVTLADTGNQRIRQLEAVPAPATQIQTIVGLGAAIPGALTLNAPSVMVYGTGQITATLSTSSPAPGSIVFLNVANTASSSLGDAPLAGNVATLAAGNLPVGAYNLTAAYTGDPTHLSAKSSAVAFTITPQPLIANIVSSTTAAYDQPIPTLTGTLTGILPQDAGEVSVSFSTTASAHSEAGSYPITAYLTGPAAGNYTVAALTSAFVIQPASTSTSLSSLVATAAAGSALTFTTQVASPAAAALAGTVTLLDGFTPLATVNLSNTGLATFSSISLAVGAHTLTALYNGDTNFTPSASTPQQIVITAGVTNPNPPATPPSAPTSPNSADFTVAATGVSTQTILSGAAANFTFTIQPQGSMSSPVILAATGLPNLATASFNPPTIPPISAVNTFTLTIATPETTAAKSTAKTKWALCFLPFLGIGLGFSLKLELGLAYRPRHRTVPAKLLAFALLGIALASTTGCGDRVNLTSAAAAAASKSYTITVTGTATTSTGGTIQHSATVTLILQPAG